MTRTSTVSDCVRELQALLGPGGFLESAADRAPFETDFRRQYRGRTPLIALPDSTAQVAAVLRACARHGTAVVPQGGNTSYCGGATPDESGTQIVLCLRRMNRIRALEPLDDAITAEAGCVLKTLQDAAAGAGRLFPLSLGSEGSCTLGGVVSTNAGGTAVLRYGMMRDLVLGLEVVLPDGRVLDQLRGLRKDNTGYDVKQLFIGAEGTLGVVTAACLRLFPRPAAHATALVGLDSPEAAVALLARLRETLGDAVTTFELIPRLALELVLRHVSGARSPAGVDPPWQALVEISLPQTDSDLAARFEAALAAELDAGRVRDAAVAASGTQREAFWRLRETIPEAQAREGGSLKHDISVATQRLPAFLAEGETLLAGLVPGARLVAYGHLGDGNLHFNLSAPPGAEAEAFLSHRDDVRRAVHDLVAAYGGSISAEHGIGRSKVGELARYEDPVALALMRALKKTLDPQGLMNPGKVLGPAD